MWVALNDQTVARLGNKQYAVVRATAGGNTVNLAAQGIVAAAIAVDDRPGETVYLTWRLGEQRFAEVDAEEGRELIAGAKQTRSIDEPRPNNERIEAIANMAQLGFDLARPVTERPSPDSEHAVITVFRRDDGPEEFDFPVWSDQRYLSRRRRRAVSGRALVLFAQCRADAAPGGVEAGKRYYAWLDFGAMVGRVRLTPITREESDDLDEWLDAVEWIEVDPSAVTARVREREQMVPEYVQSLGERARLGESDFTLLGSEHA